MLGAFFSCLISNKDNKGNAFDILKMGMALLIVAIHSNGFGGPIASVFFKPLLGIAVPVFFILSSMFYFSKLRKTEKEWMVMKGTVSRLIIFYFFWFIINIVFIEQRHRYFIDDGIFGFFRLCKDILFFNTYSGSWFISALCLAIIIYTFLNKNKTVLKAVFIFSIVELIYLHNIDLFPTEYQSLYVWLKKHFCERLTMTVLEALPWVGMGYFLSDSRVFDWFSKMKNLKKNLMINIVLIIALSVLVINENVGYDTLKMLFRIIVVLLLVITAGISVIKPRPVFFLMRKMSILFYMFHFIALRILPNVAEIIWGITSIPKSIGYINYYYLILISCFAFSLIFLYLQKHKRFDWLKYGY